MKQAAATRAKANARFLELYNQLNSEQKQAVDAIEGTVMVLAGPGTGKTQLLAMRIANILQRTQMDPWNILCVTFTESGVAAMRERLLSIMGEAAYYVRVHTFHSFCNEIIQEHPELFALAREWQPLADIERVELLESLLDALPGTSPLKIFGQPYFYLRDIGDHIKSLKQEHITPERFGAVLASLEQFVAASREAAARFFALKAGERTDNLCRDLHTHVAAAAQQAGLSLGLQEVIEKTWAEFTEALEAAEGKREASKARTAFKNKMKRWFDKTARDLEPQQALASLYAAYQQALLARGRYDYEDMINQVIAAWSTNQDLLADYQEQFQYILVDEYQDTNGAQNELVRLLGSYDDRPNICVVGDDKQSIYRFQGASLTNMLDFYEQYKTHLTIVSLQHNYRSSRTILAAADAVIAHNEESLTKYIPGTTSALVASPATGGASAGREAEPLRLWAVASAEEEDYAVAQRIKRLVEDGVKPRDIAVIVRYHRDSRGVFTYLRQLNVPVRLEAGEDALLSRSVEQFLTLLEFLADVRRDDLLARAIHFSWLGLSELDVLKVVRYAGVQRLSLWSVMDSDQHLAAAGVAAMKPWRRLVHQLAQWRAWETATSLPNFLSSVLKESGLLQHLLLSTTGPSELQAVRRLLDEAKALAPPPAGPAAAKHDISLNEWLMAIQRLQNHGLTLMTEPWQVGDDAVRVMTAHKAKGLEFDQVFLLRVIDKHWGNNPSPGKLSLPAGLVSHDRVLENQNNEDERRLFYVALTRARQGLNLSWAKHTEQGRACVPSLFLQEVPAQLVVNEEIREEWAEAQQRLVDSLQPLVARASDDVRAWVKTHVATYVMSVTHLNNYLTCPRMFYIRNILQVPAARTVYQALGTAVHEALRDWLAHYQEAAACPTREAVLEYFEWHLKREVLSAAEMRDVLDVGRRVLGAYFDQQAASFNPAAVSEFNFASHNVRVGPAAITGKIDKIEWLDDQRKTVNLVDYKTGQPDTKGAALKPGGDYHRQIVFYKLLCDNSRRFPHTMVSGEIDFVQPNKRGQFIKKRVVVSDSEVASLTQTIERVWDEIQALRFLDPAAGCQSCEYCQY